MSPKDTTINLRVTSDWVAAASDAALRLSREVGVPVSRNRLVEMAVVDLLRSKGWDDLVELASIE